MKIAYHYSFSKLIADFCAVFLAMILAYFLRQTQLVVNVTQMTKDFLPLLDFVCVSIKAGLAFVFLGIFFGMYRFGLDANLKSDFWPVFRIFLLWIFGIVLYFFVQRSFPFSRGVFVLGFVLSLSLILIFRFVLDKIFLNLALKNKHLPKAVLFGLDDADKQSFLACYPFYKFKRKSYSLTKLLENPNLCDVVVCGSEKDFAKLVRFCENNQKELFLKPFETPLAKRLHLNPFVKLRVTMITGWGRIIKRLFDVIVSLVLLLILSPLFLLLAVLVKLTSRGPVFFTANDEGEPVYRVKKNQELFTMLKFRSMIAASHTERYNNLQGANFRKDSPLVKIKNDPRVTWFGQILRRLDLDELPQLWNVLMGDMSLVGPRPHLQEEVARYAENHKFVFNVKPGITGLSQVSGRSDLSFEKEVELDRYYIQNWSFWMDLMILWKTPWVVLRGHSEFKNSKK